MYNPNFNCTEFDTIRNAAGSNNFVLSVKAWIERTGAIGIMANRIMGSENVIISSISRIPNGTHNLTMATICKISAALDAEVVKVTNYELEPAFA